MRVDFPAPEGAICGGSVDSVREGKMKERAIRVNNISKKFRIYASPKDRLKESLSFTKRQYHKEFWALRDVSFSLEKGTTMGILGINGSGKSTLLKIICGYLLPTGGGVRAEGRISSILELGTGFTSLENVPVLLSHLK